MIRCLRRIWRLALLPGWCLFIAISGLPGMFAGRRGIRWNARITRLWAKGLAAILNIRITRTGTPPDPEVCGLLISNHQSYLDILVNGAVYPLRYISQAEIRFIPVIGWFLALNRPIWVYRKARLQSAAVAEEMERSLKEKLPMVIYPEGTTSDGVSLLPFKSTSFEVLIRTGIPALPVLLRYQVPEDGQTVNWYGDIPFLPHVWHVLGQPGFEVEMYQMEPVLPLPGESRKAMAERVRELMLNQYRRMLS